MVVWMQSITITMDHSKVLYMHDFHMQVGDVTINHKSKAFIFNDT